MQQIVIRMLSVRNSFPTPLKLSTGIYNEIVIENIAIKDWLKTVRQGRNANAKYKAVVLSASKMPTLRI